MKKAMAEFIIQACENADAFFEFDDSFPEIREGYSGRSMYGENAYGIVCQNPIRVMAAVAAEMLELDSSNDLGFDVSELAKLRQDSMGRDSIILY